MATLHSEDENWPSFVEIQPGTFRKADHVGKAAPTDGQDWQNVELNLVSGKRQVRTLENEDTILCRKPEDEVGNLVTALLALANGERERLLFEPSEPSFELSFERTRRGGIKVEAWLDAGNGLTAIYTWDACGVRFFTTDEKLREFASQLNVEFQCSL